MLAAGVPCVPGWHPSQSSGEADNQSLDFLLARADEIGYPVLIKAVSGGALPYCFQALQTMQDGCSWRVDAP